MHRFRTWLALRIAPWLKPAQPTSSFTIYQSFPPAYPPVVSGTTWTPPGGSY